VLNTTPRLANTAQLYGIECGIENSVASGLEMGLNTGLSADFTQESTDRLKLVELLSPYHPSETHFRLEAQTALAFKAMADCAAKNGIKLAICSAYRPFDRQLAIWNAKASGKRDIDVFDAEQIEAKSLRLVEAEYRDGGPCAQLHQWLVANAKNFGFYFPFQRGKSAVSAEPWHISYFPVSQALLPQFEVQTLAQIIAHSDILLKDTVIRRLPELVAEYVHRIAQP